MSLILTAQTGSVVTPSQLLGNEAEERASKQAEAEKAAAKLMRKMKRKGLLGG